MVEQNRAVKRTKEKDAVSERLRKKSSKEGFGKGDRHYDGWCGHQWKRKDAGKWLRRRLPVRMRMGQAPWLRVEDTEYGCLCTGVLHDEVQPTVSRTVLRQLGWDVEDRDEVQLELEVGTDREKFVARVGEQASPSLVIGDKVLKWLVLRGWGISDELFRGDLG